MQQPLVTIVTPSYNQGHFIRATIESVLSQDYPNIEYIVMDGGSTDDTARIVGEYSNRLTFISERDRGQSHAINKGFRMARGEIVAWINSDDIILPGAVTCAVSAFQQDPKIGAVYGDGNLIDYRGNVTMRFPATIPFNLWYLVYALDYILQQTTYFRRAIFDDIGFLDETLHWGLDWDLLIRIGKKYPIRYIPQMMGCLREYGEAKTFSGGHRRFRELVRIMRKHGDMRYPPGYIAYGLLTYQEILCRRLPLKFMRAIIRRAAKSIYEPVLSHCQGLYPDQWAGPRLRYMLPPGSGKLRISGILPPSMGLHRQVLTVRLGVSLSRQFSITVGDFSVEMEVPRELAAKCVTIEVAASQYIVLGGLPFVGDRRRIAYSLKTIGWAE